MNPHQRPAAATPLDAAHPPLRVLHGEPSYINLLDALGAWQLVREAAGALGRPAAASFKHVSPAGAATAGPIDAVMAETYGVDGAALSGVASAYVRARDTDPKSSYGDFVAVSEPVDEALAQLLRRVVCDGIVAPGYAPGTMATLSAKKGGGFLVLEADPAFRPPAEQVREEYGYRFVAPRDDIELGPAHLADPVCGTLPGPARDDLLLGLITVRYTQSNSVAYVRDGMTLGVGAGQQSRVDCVRLAGAKAGTWWLRRHPAVRAVPVEATARVQDRVGERIRYLDGDLPGVAPLAAAERGDWLARLDGVSLASDGALPFRDNVDHARRHGVRYIAEPGGAARSGDVVAACREHGMTLCHTGVRLFRH
ncbi:phosphoribosylaminoimidazolecarboxamide formyltransferase [Rugosimonospora acidiphila]|uniref:Phosphoribosylaminoimidazolecarboxamide formyltransferase n=2 Tax=Rugosimonospora acidiphila TaxID=556531 RepID=A0ABP9SS62_9ACTN